MKHIIKLTFRICIFVFLIFLLNGCSLSKPDCVEALTENAPYYKIYNDLGREYDCPPIIFEDFEITKSESDKKSYYAEGTATGKDNYCNYEVDASLRFHKYDQGWEVENIEFGQLKQNLYRGVSMEGLYEWFTSYGEEHFPEIDDWRILGTRLNDSDMDGIADEQMVEVVCSQHDNICYEVIMKEIILVYDYEPGHWKFGTSYDIAAYDSNSYPSYLLVKDNIYSYGSGSLKMKVSEIPGEGRSVIIVEVLENGISGWETGKKYRLLAGDITREIGEDLEYTIAREYAAGYYQYVQEDDYETWIEFLAYPYDGRESIMLSNGMICYLEGQPENEIAIAQEANAQYYRGGAWDGYEGLKNFLENKEEDIELFDLVTFDQYKEVTYSEQDIKDAISMVNHIDNYLGYVPVNGPKVSGGMATRELWPFRYENETVTEEQLSRNVEIIKNRANVLGVEADVFLNADQTIDVSIPAAGDAEDTLDILSSRGQFWILDFNVPIATCSNIINVELENQVSADGTYCINIQLDGESGKAYEEAMRNQDMIDIMYDCYDYHYVPVFDPDSSYKVVRMEQIESKEKAELMAELLKIGAFEVEMEWVE